MAGEGGQGAGAASTAGGSSSKPGHTATLIHCSQLQWGDLKLHRNDSATYTSSTSDTYRQIQDSGNRKGPLGRVQSRHASYKNTVFTRAFVFLALVSLSSPKFILEFKDDQAC